MGMTEYDEETAHRCFFEDGVYFTEQHLQPIIDQKDAQLTQQASQLSQKDAELSQQASQLSQKDAELQRLQAYIVEHGLTLPQE